MKRKVGEFIIILIFLACQCTLGRAISLAGIGPNFLILIPVFFGYLNGKNEGIYTGFMAGLMYDLFSSEIVGFSALVFLYIGFLAGCFYQKYEESEMLMPICMIFGGDFVFGLVAYIGNFLLHNKLDVFFYVSRIVVPEAVYTVLAGLLLYKLMIRVNRLCSRQERKRAGNFDERNV